MVLPEGRIVGELEAVRWSSGGGGCIVVPVADAENCWRGSERLARMIVSRHRLERKIRWSEKRRRGIGGGGTAVETKPALDRTGRLWNKRHVVSIRTEKLGKKDFGTVEKWRSDSGKKNLKCLGGRSDGGEFDRWTVGIRVDLMLVTVWDSGY